MEETLRELDNLLNEGRTEDVFKKVNDILVESDWKNISLENLAELHALRGMAFYRRKEFEDARTDFRFALGTDPANDRAIYGMAYLAAYANKDPAKTREWMEKLPESAARDNAWMIVLRSQEYLEANGFLETGIEVDEIIGKWAKPNPDDPLNVANIFHNGARFHIVVGDKLVEAGESDISYYAPAVMLLECAIGLYGMGDMNLHHRAAANYWKSVAMEKLLGPAAALASAEQSLDLWKKQLKLDPANPHFQRSYENARERIDDLYDRKEQTFSPQS